MNFEFTEEQNMVRDQLSRFLRDKYDFAAREKILSSADGYSRDIWRGLADMGIMAAAFPEEFDGFGGKASDTLVIMEELGKALVVEPFLPAVILAGQALRAAGGDLARQLIAEICGGDLIMGLGAYEPSGRFSLSHCATKAEAAGENYKLTGYKAVVLGAPIAGKLIVSARHSGSVGSESGLSLYVVDTDAPGVTIHGYKNIDGHMAGDVILDSVPAILIGEKGSGYGLLRGVIDHALLAAAAEGTGICKVMCLMTNQYIQQREQFGQPISKFQVLQHAMVDMFIHQEELMSMSLMCAAKMDSGVYNVPKAAAAAKVQLGKSCKFVGENAVQLHGGMGITEEMAIGHYFMRGTMLELVFGNTDFYIGRYMNEKEAA